MLLAMRLCVLKHDKLDKDEIYFADPLKIFFSFHFILFYFSHCKNKISKNSKEEEKFILKLGRRENVSLQSALYSCLKVEGEKFSLLCRSFV